MAMVGRRRTARLRGEPLDANGARDAHTAADVQGALFDIVVVCAKECGAGNL